MYFKIFIRSENYDNKNFENIIPKENFIIKANPVTKKEYDYKKILNDWTRSHGDNNSNKLSHLSFINPQNIKNLELAWIYNSNDKKGLNLDIQANPIAIDGTIYTPVVGGHIVAIEGSSGKEIWRSEKFNNDVARRGLVYWFDEVNKIGKIFFNNGSKLISLDSKSGKKDLSFGKKGYIRTGYSKTTPIIFKQNIIIASWKKDLEVYDIYSGKLKWKYHFGDQNRSRIGKFKYNNLKGGNPWGGISLDEKRGIVYITTGNPSNYFDGTRRPGLNYNSNSIIAISLKQKKQIWSFQETIHDIWNLDIPAPPVLTSLKKGNEFYDVVVAVTKLGNTIILDRVTGKPFFDIKYKKVPQSNIENETTSNYQININTPEPFSNNNFSLNNITNINKKSEEYISSIVKNSSFGYFEPPKLDKNTIMYNFHGGAEWMGASIDHDTQNMFVNSNEIPWLISLTKDKDNKLISKFTRLKDQDGLPGGKPPWGKITSLNLNTGKINWSIPFGNYTKVKTKDGKKTGSENFGGLIVTSSGLIFATGTMDKMFYVFDSNNGKELFKYELPYIGSAPPTTFINNNEQYIIVQSTGSYSLNQGYPNEISFGDAIVAFKIKK
jgi:quinoprotein glucose dehydrogenase